MGEESATDKNIKKRDRDVSGELESVQPELKRTHLVSLTDSDPLPGQFDAGKVTESTGSEICEPTSPASGGGEIDDGTVFQETDIPEDILDILDDADTMPEIQDLDSVIRSFEEEILQVSPSSVKPQTMEFRQDSGEYQPDLGYLLEASDDELGLPPTVSNTTEQPNQEHSDSCRNGLDVDALGDMIGFENELPSYDTFGFEMGENIGEVDNGNGGFVNVDGLFDHSESSDFGWRPESLPAL